MQEERKIYVRVRNSKRIARDGCTRRRNRIPQIDEVDEEGAVPTAGEEEAGNDVEAVSIGRSK